MASKRGKNSEFELAKYVAKRDIYYSELERLYQLSLNIDTSEKAGAFLTVFSGYEETRERFLKMMEVVNDLHFQINPDYRPDYELLKNAERFRCSITAAAKNLNKNEVEAPTPSGAYKLPKITVPEFDGEIAHWPIFFEKFESIIHRNPNLDDLAKLHYLMGALKGKALDLCVGLTPSAANYPILLGILKTNYNKKRLLADHFIKQIFDVKPLTAESLSGLNQNFIRVDTAYKSFRNLCLPDPLDFFMTNILLSKLDPQTRRAFETSKHEPIPSYAEVSQFLHDHIDALAQVPKPQATTKNSTSSPKTLSTSGYKTFVSQVAPFPKTTHNNNNNNNSDTKINEVNNPIKCPVCCNSHQVFRCESFLRLSPSDRLQLVQNGDWCINCLSHSHSVKACNSRFTCRICNKDHHTLIHLGNSADNASSSAQTSPQPEEKPACNFFTNYNSRTPESSSDENVSLLPTAVVHIETPFGDRQARFLIDSGSQRNLISETCCREFHLSFQPKLVPLEGMGNVPLQAVGITNFAFKSRYNSKIRFQVSALVTERITHQLPANTVQVENLQFLRGLPLADKEFFRPGSVDGILGAQLFGQILTGPAVIGPSRTTHAVPTSLGHIVMGEAPCVSPDSCPGPNPVATFCILDNQGLNRAVQKFWELEEIPSNPKLTKEEKDCEELFQRTTTRVSGKRYSVELPFKEYPPLLGDSFRLAEKRFCSLERRFKKDPDFRAQYVAVVQDYLSQGHLSPVPSALSSNDSAYFIPHFAVLKQSSSTPLRIVFDASARSSNGRSLNDVLFTGPKLQKDITQILLSFRTSAVALMADIRQMYRNILVHPQHRPFQRILWRESPQDPLQVYQLNCVVFGVTSAPYLALRTVLQLAADEAKNFPLAAQLTERHMYVDDLVVSLESVPAAIEAYKQLEGLFKAGGFKLTKWASNSPELLEAIPPDERVSQLVDFSDSSRPNDVIKVLGLTWDPISDAFAFKIKPLTPIFTKRGVLSVIARIWDPLGFLTPVTLHAKLLVKELWNTGLDWDDELPQPFHSRWRQFITELPSLQDIYIARHFGTCAGTTATLIGFADSSEKGYGAVIYLRCVREEPVVRLLCAKSRVAPQKTVTLPKLELCAATLLSQLIGMCTATLSSHFQSISKIALTDSTVTLAWLKNDTCKREVFVANRVSLIEETLAPDNWFHVRSEENMADIISRGLSPAQLLAHTTWFQGPSWLKSNIQDWPIQAEVNSPRGKDLTLNPPPQDPIISLLSTAPKVTEDFEPFLRRFSSWKKLLRVTICLLRFCKRLPSRARGDPVILETAERIIIRQVQREHFPEELALLQKDAQLSAKFRSLSPFLDGEIIRVGGRLSHSDLPYEAKHPILLPKSSHLSTLIIKDYHESNLHTGPNLVCAIVRQKYWILSARSAVRKIISSCNLCFKRNPRPNYPPMADLPAARVQEAKPFLQTGVDYAGPFQITISRRRGVKSQKAYLCLFICLATKAVHLELASSLSSDTFLACFKRFIARRGPVQALYSDRGTNFIGAKAELDKIHDFVQTEAFLNPIATFLEDRRISWKFNPPLSPHFGGIWEANIRSVKTHLSKVIGSQTLSYEEFNTVLVQIEALLNSRPLCQSSPDPAEPEALTPAHFLTLTPLLSLPLSDRIPHRPHNARKALLDSIVRSFWDRWRKDYLTSLNPRSKWTSATSPLKVGTVVVVRSDSAPPLQWPLAVVEEVHPGPDGVIRVATVRIGANSFQRPVVKLCPLPTQ